jgi:hypothetical protein
MVNPVLKWAGGKRQLLDELYARFPADFSHYHEPMSPTAYFTDYSAEGFGQEGHLF